MTTSTPILAPYQMASVEPLGEVLARPEELPDVPEFRIASYNVYNLFGKEHDVYTRRESEPASAEQLTALADMIIDLQADAIAFQEVQNEKVLSDLFRKKINPRLRRRDEPTFTSFVCIPAADPRGINVALATRFAVRSSLTFHDREFGDPERRAVKFSRDLLGVELYATPTYRFLFFVSHLKSKMGGDSSELKRRSEGQEIRSIFEGPVFGGGTLIDQDLILAGDMNDDPDKKVIDILQGTDPQTALTDVLREVDPNYTYPTHTRYKKTRLDYIFASPSMTRRLDEATIHRDEPAATASDHFPVSVVVDVTQQS
ncbi:MAG: endonuclease/exonuclease/phosphatase family protein [Gammaproteobacteria bacterium]|nr:endonuclease/exonuclease/phosphatase family protein [Gammaproteobacteria bacterium]